MKKTKLLLPLATILSLVMCAIIIIILSRSAIPTDASLSKLTQVPRYDILQDQAEREQQILLDYNAGSYSFKNPYVIVDPYEMNPCTALVLFDSNTACDIKVEITGDDAESTIRYSKSVVGGRCEIPIIGLYAGRENQATLSDQSGNSVELLIKTEPLPLDFQTFQLEKAIPDQMEPGFTLLTACFDHTYSALLDHNAQVRGYLSNKNMGHGTSMILLRNGNMLSTGDEYKQIPYNMSSIWEFNWMGKLFREYEIPNGVHHSISELPNGDILAVSNNRDMFHSGTREDVVIIIDRNTGEVIREYDFRTILDETRNPYHHFHPDIINPPNVDWMHTNAAIYDAANNSLIVSSPTQSQVICIDAETSQIKWILGPHEGYEGSSARLKQYLLEPVSGIFEWQWCQHDPMLLPDIDSNPDTIDLLLLDNGQSKCFAKEDAIGPAKNYSRAVQFRIDQKKRTVEQIWQYGKERGSECYATFLGSADYLPNTGNSLINFGGQLRVNGVPVDDILGGVLNTVVINSRIVEVDTNGRVVYEVSSHDNAQTVSAETYQATRLPIYCGNSFNYHLGEIVGARLGTSYTCGIAEGVKAPPLFIGQIGVDVSRIWLECNRLIMEGNLTYRDKTYLLGRAMVVLRSKNATYVYEANSGLNGRFFLSLDTQGLAPGTYQISIVGGVKEGNDAQAGKLYQGHVKTNYKITIQ